MTPYGDINQGQHWFRLWLVAWRHQTITWTNVDLSSVRSSGIHLSAILKEIPQPSVTEINLKITYLNFCSNLLGANELTTGRKIKSLVTTELLLPQGHSALLPYSWSFMSAGNDMITGVDIKHLVYMPIRHMVLRIYMPWFFFYMPSQYFYKPCKADILLGE